MPKKKKEELIQDDALRALLLPFIDAECTKRDLQLDTAGRAEVVDMLKAHTLGAVKAGVKLVFEVALDVEDEDDDEVDYDSDEGSAEGDEGDD